MTNYVQIPPDSTGKKIIHRQSTDDTSIYTPIVHVADRYDETKLQSINDYGAALVSFNEGQPSLDAFGNLRVTEESVLGAYDHVTDSQDDLYSIVAISGGTQIYESQKSLISLNVNGDAGAMTYRMTNRYHHYMPGTGTLILLTIALGDAGKVGNERCWGYTDGENGFSFILSGTTLGVRLRSDTTGAVVNTIIPQNEWNGDKLDGTGVSGYIIDITKRNLYWISFAWLGVGAIRMGVIGYKGERIVCHTFSNVNGDPFPYTSTATLPLTVANFNREVTGSGSEIKFICGAVYSDSSPKYVFWRHANTETPNMKQITTDTPILSMRGKLLLPNGKTNRVNAYPETVTVFVSGGTAKISYFDGVYNGILTGDTWNIEGEGVIAADTTATAIDLTGLSPMFTYYLDAGSHMIDISRYYELNDEGIHINADKTQHTYSFVGTKLSGDNVSVMMALTYRELY